MRICVDLALQVTRMRGYIKIHYSVGFLTYIEKMDAAVTCVAFVLKWRNMLDSDSCDYNPRSHEKDKAF